MSEYFVFPGCEALEDPRPDAGEQERQRRSELDSHASYLAGAAAYGMQEKSCGGWSRSKVQKNPEEFVRHSLGIMKTSPDSLHRHVRNVVEICDGLQMDTPAQTARILQQINVGEAADLASRRDAHTARVQTDEMLSILAEDGDTDGYYESDNSALQQWIIQTAQAVSTQVLQRFTRGDFDPEKVEKVKENPRELAKIMVATSVALADIDVSIQEAIGEQGHGHKHLHYSVLALATNHIRDAVMSRVLMEVAGWWKRDFPLLEYHQCVQGYTKSAAYLRAELLRTNSEIETKFKSVMRERLPNSLRSLNDASSVFNQALGLPDLAATLRESSLNARGREMAPSDTFYPDGHVSVIAQIDDRWLGHYAIDGAKKRQTIGIHSTENREPHAFGSMYPYGNPGYSTSGYRNMHITPNGTVFPNASNHLAPKLPFDDIGDMEEVFASVARALNAQMKERAGEYRELFEHTGEVSPLIFLDMPNDEIVLFPSNDDLDHDIPPLVGTDLRFPSERIPQLFGKYNAGVQQGNWAAICQPVIAERLRQQQESETTATEVVTGAEPINVDPVKSGQARFRRVLKSYAEPSLQDLLVILRDTEGVAEVVHQPKGGKGSGSHQEIIVLFADGRTTKQDTWRKIQKAKAKIKWPTLLKMIGPGKLDIPLETFVEAVQTGRRLKPSRRSEVQGSKVEA